jgi:flagellar hook-associated protein 2
MSTISSAGIGSGLDVESIVTKLVALERQPITELQTQATSIQSKISSWGQLKSALSSVGDAAKKLATASTWNARGAFSTDPSSVSVKITGTNGGALGRVTVKPTQLSAAQSNASTGFTNTTDSVGTGSLTIQLGSWSSAPAFTPQAGASAVTINIGSGEDSLSSVRDKINAANAGVTASIVFDGTANRLVINSSTTGASNGFRITATDTDGNATDAAGLSRLTYDPPSSSQLTRNVASADAIAFVNNLEVHSATNTFDTAIEGASFTINKVSATDVPVDFSSDTVAIKGAIDQFVSAYNALNGLVRQTTNVSESGSASNGPLQGDRSAISLQSSMRSMLRESGANTSDFGKLTDIGLNVARDGSISFDNTKLTAALAKPNELSDLFVGSATDSTNYGVAKKLSNAITSMLGVDGSISTRTDALTASLKRNSTQQQRDEDHVAQVEKRLRAQYTALDTRMASLTSLSSYVTQQVAAWNKSGS